jgi:hypothetical protein
MKKEKNYAFKMDTALLPPEISRSDGSDFRYVFT